MLGGSVVVWDFVFGELDHGFPTVGESGFHPVLCGLDFSVFDRLSAVVYVVVVYLSLYLFFSDTMPLGLYVLTNDGFTDVSGLPKNCVILQEYTYAVLS